MEKCRKTARRFRREIKKKTGEDVIFRGCATKQTAKARREPPIMEGKGHPIKKKEGDANRWDQNSCENGDLERRGRYRSLLKEVCNQEVPSNSEGEK